MDTRLGLAHASSWDHRALHAAMTFSQAVAVRQGGTPRQRNPAALGLGPGRDLLARHASLQYRLSQVLVELNETFDPHQTQRPSAPHLPPCAAFVRAPESAAPGAY